MKLTSRSTSAVGASPSTATDSSEASETSSLVGYVKLTWSNSIRAGPRGNAVAPGFSATIGGRSSTSNTRSKETSAVMMSTLMLESAVSGP